MNFFEHQSRAKRRTSLLAVYFLLAVVMIVLAVNLAVYLVFYAVAGESSSKLVTAGEWFGGPLAFWISIATLVLIVLGSLNTMLQLRGGGRAIARMVGARKVNTNTNDLGERRLINTVEEMSIASGTPVPELYVMEDPAINAFVAGYRPTEVVMVVTSGALQNFNRDELQGVVGHEYSHIFNGDMRLNIRLMGLLAGILLIGQIGGFILRSSGRRRGGSDKGGGQIMLLGLALFVIGYIGLFFGSLIKAAISRQREFLADASSVQFTRNPDGIAGALWVIKENAEGSKLLNSHADDVSHFCFSNAVANSFFSMLATHPPLEERIKAVNPRYNPAKRRAPVPSPRPEPEAGGGSPGGVSAAAGIAGAAIAAAVIESGRAVRESVGQVRAEHLDYAERTMAGLPEEIHALVHDEASVPQFIYALVVADMKEADRERALQLLTGKESAESVRQVRDYSLKMRGMDKSFRLPLINMSIPVLKSLDLIKRAAFLTVLEELVRVDNRYTLFEFALVTILREHLAENAGRDVAEKYFSYDKVIEEIDLLLSVLARSGADEEGAKQVHAVIIRQFSPSIKQIQDRSQCKLENISTALKKLNQLTPMLKQTVIQAFADCVIHDGTIKVTEAELLQAIAISLDCPVPPLVV